MSYEFPKYVDQINVQRDYSDLACFDYLEAMFPGFHNSVTHRSHALEEERGSLSWGAALIGRSYLRIYESTSDDKYLRAFVGVAEQMLLARDSVRGAVDYRGISGPVWRSGRPYSTNIVTFECGRSVTSCVEIRSKQANYIRIENVRASTTEFDISFYSDLHGVELASFSDVCLLPGEERCLSDVLARQEWKSPQAAAVISHSGCLQCLPEPGMYALEEQYYAPAVHVSQVCIALLEFARIIARDPGLETVYGPYCRSYVEAAIEALEVFDPDYRITGSAGHYVIPADAPNDFEGTDAPLNHNMSMALCFLLLYRVTRKTAYKTRASQLLKTFRASVKEVEMNESTCLVWPYFVPSLINYRGHSGGNVSRWRSARKGNPRMEDMSHAVIAVEAAVEAHSQGLEITQHDLECMANTFIAAAATGSLANYVDGTAGNGKYDDIAGRWAILAPWEKSVYPTALEIMQAAQPQPVHASIVLACANLAGFKPQSS